MTPVGWLKELHGRWHGARAVTRAHLQTLREGHGHALSLRRREPVDARGHPLPWFTYPAIEYLRQLDFSKRTVFEFGAGGSTLFWSERVARVVTVEHDATWHARMRGRIPPNVDLLHAPESAGYVAALSQRPGSFDIIVVDGVERRACCAAALHKLAPGGLIILDNADWHHRCAEVLRRGDLLEVDMTGFGPINDYTWTTSFFFHREFRALPAGPRQPMPGAGAVEQIEPAT